MCSCFCFQINNVFSNISCETKEKTITLTFFVVFIFNFCLFWVLFLNWEVVQLMKATAEMIPHKFSPSKHGTKRYLQVIGPG